MISVIETINNYLNTFIWGVPAIVCIIGVGLYLSIGTGFIQLRKFGYAMKATLGRMFEKKNASQGSITPFQAVCTALAATIGTGNIAGVAGAWYSHLFQNFSQFIVIHTAKGFGIVNKAEIDVFLELSCFFHDPADVGNLISGSSAFSKTSLNIRKFTVHILLKPGLENVEHYFTSV